MYDIERVKTEFIGACASQGVEINVPIIANGRLTRTLGRVFFIPVGEKYEPQKVEFSKQLLATATDASVRSVILHEAAHYIVTSKTGEHHGHDATFKAMCARLGCENDKTTTVVDRIVSDSQIYKYQIYCSTCCKTVGGRSRRCAIVDHPENWTCGCCGKPTLSIIQNW